MGNTIGPIMANAMTSRIVERLPASILRNLRRQADDILAYRNRGNDNMRQPIMTYSYSRQQHEIPGVHSFTIRWSSAQDGTNMRLKAEVVLGGDKPAMKIAGNQAEIIIDLPDAALKAIRNKPITALIDSEFLEGYKVHKILGRKAYLSSPNEIKDVGPIVLNAPKDEKVGTEQVLTCLADHGFVEIDYACLRFFKRIVENKTLIERLTRELAKGNKEIQITDLVPYHNPKARISLIVVQGDNPENHILSLRYQYENFSYENGLFSYACKMASLTKSPDSRCFLHIPYVKRYSTIIRLKRPTRTIDWAIEELKNDRIY